LPSRQCQNHHRHPSYLLKVPGGVPSLQLSPNPSMRNHRIDLLQQQEVVQAFRKGGVSSGRV
jgi:hypothetical protein